MRSGTRPHRLPRSAAPPCPRLLERERDRQQRLAKRLAPSPGNPSRTSAASPSLAGAISLARPAAPAGDARRADVAHGQQPSRQVAAAASARAASHDRPGHPAVLEPQRRQQPAAGSPPTAESPKAKAARAGRHPHRDTAEVQGGQSSLAGGVDGRRAQAPPRRPGDQVLLPRQAPDLPSAQGQQHGQRQERGRCRPEPEPEGGRACGSPASNSSRRCRY